MLTQLIIYAIICILRNGKKGLLIVEEKSRSEKNEIIKNHVLHILKTTGNETLDSKAWEVSDAELKQICADIEENKDSYIL